jgi:hypothetical protein
MSDLAAAEARIRRVIAAKNVGAANYWRARGRARFERELAEDAVPLHESAGLLDTIDRELFPPVDLGEVLQEMKERAASAGCTAKSKTRR